jgi:hypothetical protein
MLVILWGRKKLHCCTSAAAAAVVLQVESVLGK